MITKIFLLFAAISLTACGMQKRASIARQKVAVTQKALEDETATLKQIQDLNTAKMKKNEIDSVNRSKYDSLINSLNSYLTGINTNTKYVTDALSNKKAFRESQFEIQNNINKLNAFHSTKAEREKIYALLAEAVRSKAFSLYNLAAFFDPGIYKISPSATAQMQASFQPAIDSIIALSNKFSDVPHTISIVFVGFADETAIASGTPLYNELTFFVKDSLADRHILNAALSDLRARELSSNMKNVIGGQVKGFTNYKNAYIGYYSYGRGEAYPFANITDYTPNDERRRVVLCYWSVLPKIRPNAKK